MASGGIWGPQVTAAIGVLNLSRKAKVMSTKISVLIAMNTPIMVDKVDEEGNVVKDITKKPIKVPLKDESGEIVYQISKEDGQAIIDSMDESVNTMCDSNQDEGKLLASKLNHLAKATVGLYERIIKSAAAIIGTCALGPTISPQLLMPLIDAITGEAQNLSTIYDEAEDKIKKLQLNDEGIQAAKFDLINLDDFNIPDEIRPNIEPIVAPLISTINAGAGDNIVSLLSGLTSGIKILMESAAFACSLCGAACGSLEAALEVPEVESPLEEKKAQDCDNYIGPYTSQEQASQRDASNCSKFKHVFKKDEDLTDDDYKCDNCKFYKK